MRGLAFMMLAACLANACGGSSGGGDDTPATGDTPSPEASILIGAVQGTGPISPLEGRTVTVRGVVTGDFQDNDADDQSNLGGFYITGLPDPDINSSDGIFVFDGNNPAVDVDVGDNVSVTGEVVEFFGETQLHVDSVSVVGRGQVQPASLFNTVDTALNSDGDPIPDFERFEGMLVRFTNTLTVSDTFGLDRYGEVRLAEGGRIFQFTNSAAPSVDGFADYRRETARRTIILDDGRRDLSVRPVRYLRPDKPLRVGDKVESLTGVLRYSRGSGDAGAETWRLMPTQTPVFARTNPRPPAPNPGGTLTVAGINLLNFFTSIDDGDPTCGPGGDSGCRGADSPEEFQRQLAKSVAQLVAIDADIVGLIEIENNSSESLVALVQALEDKGLNYDYIDTGIIGGDSIKVGLIYKPDSVAPSGDFAILDQSVDARFIDRKNRPVLAQTFRQLSNDAQFTIAVNHLKSKGSDCDDVGDPNRNDGQGNCSLTRTGAAQAMGEWLAGDPTGSGDGDVLIVGDINAYTMEDPLTALADAGYVNLTATLQEAESYSFVFRGASGALDHALANESLAAQVTGALDWHVNADEPRLIDYNLEGDRDPAWFDGDEPYRSSDHDPLVIGLQLTTQ
ncbi:MAG: ExeM/NucH family extracellular endonuclease [Woeseiaceae bacterium]|nr:ExeM/NucH family extracellular endonuclease [Woeseiaceae bacterium]